MHKYSPPETRSWLDRGLHWPLFICGGIGVVMIVNIGFLLTALSRPVFLVDERPYEAGVSYQEMIDDEKWLKENGFSFTLTSSKATNELVLLWQQQDEHPSSSEKFRVSVQLSPLFVGETPRLIPMNSCGAGRLCAPFDGRSGRWRAEVTISVNERTVKTRRILLV